MNKKIKYSVVVPIYNDAYLAEAFCNKIKDVFVGKLDELELLFINDGSSNNSLQVLLNLASSNDFVIVIDLSRNFGQHQALACGYKMAKGTYVIRMNVDMQDPPEEILKLIAVMNESDLDIVVGKYCQRKSSISDKLTAYLYFKFFGLMTGLKAEQNTSPLRVMNQRFIAAYNRLTEKSRFPQGLDLWLGFRQSYVTIEHRYREDKRSSYNFRSRLSLAVDGLLYFSDRPLRLVVSLGFVLSTLGVGLGFIIVFLKVLGVSILSGWASLISLSLIVFGIQLMSIGVVGLYVGKVFVEVQNRPLYLIRECYEGRSGIDNRNA